jgi:hypothetical protein
MASVGVPGGRELADRLDDDLRPQLQLVRIRLRERGRGDVLDGGERGLRRAACDRMRVEAVVPGVVTHQDAERVRAPDATVMVTAVTEDVSAPPIPNVPAA